MPENGVGLLIRMKQSQHLSSGFLLFFLEVNNWSWLIGNARDEKIEAGSPQPPAPIHQNWEEDTLTMMPLPGKNGDLFRKRKEMFSPLLNHLCQAMRRNHAFSCRWKWKVLSIFWLFVWSKDVHFWGVMSSQVACMLRFSFIWTYPYKKVECTTWLVQCVVVFSDLSLKNPFETALLKILNDKREISPSRIPNQVRFRCGHWLFFGFTDRNPSLLGWQWSFQVQYGLFV